MSNRVRSHRNSAHVFSHMTSWDTIEPCVCSNQLHGIPEIPKPNFCLGSASLATNRNLIILSSLSSRPSHTHGTCQKLSFAAASQVRFHSSAVHFVIALEIVARAQLWHSTGTPQSLNSRNPTGHAISHLGDTRSRFCDGLRCWEMALTPSALLTTMRKGVEVGVCFVRPNAPDVIYWMADLPEVSSKRTRANVGQIG